MVCLPEIQGIFLNGIKNPDPAESVPPDTDSIQWFYQVISESLDFMSSANSLFISL